MTVMKVVVMVPLFALFCVGGASKSVDVVSPGLKQMWEHFDKKVSSLENDLQEEKQLRTDMQGQIDSLTSQVDSLVKQNKDQQTQIDQCTCDSMGSHLRRRNQEHQSSVCGREAVQSMLAVCCASESPGNGHRLQEIEGCDTLPPTCSLECSSQFISIFDNCQEEPLMEGLSSEDMEEWNEFYTDCSEVEQSAAEMGVLQPVNVRMFRIMISSDAPQSQAAMFGNDGSPPAPPLGPLPDLPPSPPPSPDSSSTDLEQYHAQCTTSNILTCVPACNSTTHGYELLATIDGTDTKFSCNLANMLFSWVGAAALGGYLGRNVQAFVPAVISGAAGTYVLTLAEDADVGTDLMIQPGQHVIISGDAGLVEAPRWGSGVAVHANGKMTFNRVITDEYMDVLPGGLIKLLNGAEVTGIISKGIDGTFSREPKSLVWDEFTFTQHNSDYRLVMLGPHAIGSTHDEQVYADACASLGLRPVMMMTGQNNDDCDAYNCIRAPDWGFSEFFVSLGAVTGWVSNCQGDAPCDGPPLVCFSPYRNGFATAGGLFNSVGGNNDFGWGDNMHPVCGLDRG
eukprot:SAG11_NODE_290_length_11190_cov_12.004872_1_plen_566_part_00